MTTGFADQLEALQRIATFSAALRGHALGEWQSGPECVWANCTKCGAQLRAYPSPLQPDLDGPALSQACKLAIADRAA